MNRIIVCLCAFFSTVALAQNASVDNLKLASGESIQLVVSFNFNNDIDYTAFQFDMMLPAGIVVDNAQLNNKCIEDHEIASGLVNEEKNTYRLLGYSMSNSNIINGDELIYVTLTASDDFKSEEETSFSLSNSIVVSAQCKKSDVTPTVSPVETSSITIGEVSKTTYVSDKWFDMQGHRLNQPTNSGLYIRNGKKVVIK